MQECLKELIGIISTTEIPSPPTDYDKSSSGLFLLEGSENTIIKKGCENINLLELSDIAIKSSIRQTCEAFLVYADLSFKKRVENVSGWVGVRKREKTPAKNMAVNGILITPKNIRNSFFEIDKFSVWVTKSDTYTIKINKITGEDITDVEEIYSQDVTTTTPGIYMAFGATTPIKLPLSSTNEQFYYVISYEISNGGAPIYNELLLCNCNTHQTNHNNKMKSAMVLSGLRFDSYTEITNAGVENISANGLGVYGTVSCDSSSLICQNIKDESYSKVLSTAIYYKAIANLIQLIMDSKSIDMYTLLTPEVLYGKRNHFTKEWKDRIEQYLVDNINLEDGGCYVCEDSRMFVK